LDLNKIRCVGCEGGIPALTDDQIQTYLPQVPEWTLSADHKWISRQYRFNNFYQTMAFINAVAWIANQENHHPDLELGYNYCHVKFMTHAVKGLTQNDFICAAKINALEVN
jgi:4a-hydroxytetrahydrobiopterin dehydratase